MRRVLRGAVRLAIRAVLSSVTLGAFLAAVHAGGSSARIVVPVDVLPGETRNIVDLASQDAVPVALLASSSLDVRSIDPGSLHLAGAATVKDASGATHAFGDVDGDGAVDLIVWFRARDIRVADSDARVTVEGATVGREKISGNDAIQTLASALTAQRRQLETDRTGGDPTAEEKLPPLRAGIEIVAERPTAEVHADVPDRRSVAILGRPDLDVRDVVIDTIRIGGRPTTKTWSGDIASYEDANADGVEDLVVAVSIAPSGTGSELRDPRKDTLTLTAATATGRLVEGAAAQVEAPADGPAAKRPVEAESEAAAPATRPSPLDVTADGAGSAAPPSVSDGRWPGFNVQGRYPGAIPLPDLGPASVYPASITISGASGVVSKVRVTLNGVIHSCFADLDVLLVAPSGQSLVLISDSGWCNGEHGPFYMTFDDFGTSILTPGQEPSTMSPTYMPRNGFGADPFVAPAPPPTEARGLSSFTGTNPNGEWKLFIVDDKGLDTGVITDGWTLDIVTMSRFCSATPITVPAGAPGTTQGPGSVYPSTISISTLTQPIAKVTVTLEGLSHQAADNLDILLIAPSGIQVPLMSDAIGPGGFSDLQVTFDDDTSFPVAPSPGTYHPMDFEPGDVYPPPAPPEVNRTSLDALRGTLAYGDWRLYVADDANGSVGALSGGWCVNITTYPVAESCQPFSVTIPAGAPGQTQGPASPYPSVLHVTGTSGLVDSVDVKLVGLFHTYPDDLDILLESPSGRKLMLMSDAGGFQDVVNLDLGISYNSSVLMPDEGALTLSSYQPADYEPGESLPAPAPAAPYTDDLNLDVPNGNWKLWVNDDAGADVGKILGGWCLSLRVAEPFVTTCTDASSSLTIPGAAPSATSGPAAPYPWELNVGYEGVVVRKVRVRLEGLTHTYPDDLDILVLGPVGGAAILMSDAGGEFDASNALIGWDDDSPTNMPDASTLPSATYRPTNHNTGNPDVFTDLGVGPFGSQLSVFRGLPAKGTWKLYVMDDSDFDVGSATRWCVDIWPLSPVGEATNLRWTSKTAMRWDAAPNASLYDVYRGTPGQLAPLLTALEDSCLAITDHDQTAEGLASLPSPGSMFWYLVVGTNGTYRGPAGNARIGTTPTARTLDSAGACAAP